MEWLIVALLAVGTIAFFWRSIRRVRGAFSRHRRTLRIAKGYCPQCEYDFAGRAKLPSNLVCPECGCVLSEREAELLENIYPVLLKTREGDGAA